MSNKSSNNDGAGQVQSLGEQGTPWSGCLTLIIGLIIAAAMIYIAGGV
jgi:hypothetical protein